MRDSPFGAASRYDRNQPGSYDLTSPSFRPKSGRDPPYTAIRHYKYVRYSYPSMVGIAIRIPRVASGTGPIQVPASAGVSS